MPSSSGRKARFCVPASCGRIRGAWHQVQDLEKRRGGEILRITYNKVNPTWTLPQLLWLRENEPEAMDRVERIFFTKDYLRYRLTGTWETDHIDAQGSMLFDGGTRRWSAELIGSSSCPYPSFPLSFLQLHFPAR